MSFFNDPPFPETFFAQDMIRGHGTSKYVYLKAVSLCLLRDTEDSDIMNIINKYWV